MCRGLLPVILLAACDAILPLGAGVDGPGRDSPDLAQPIDITLTDRTADTRPDLSPMDGPPTADVPAVDAPGPDHSVTTPDAPKPDISASPDLAPPTPDAPKKPDLAPPKPDAPKPDISSLPDLAPPKPDAPKPDMKQPADSQPSVDAGCSCAAFLGGCTSTCPGLAVKLRCSPQNTATPRCQWGLPVIEEPVKLCPNACAVNEPNTCQACNEALKCCPPP